MNKLITLFTISYLATSFLQAGSFMKKGGSKFFKSIQETVRSTAEVVTNSQDYSDLTQEELVKLTPEQRKEFLQKQFISQEDLKAIGDVEKEEINVEIEAIQFFESLNPDTAKPIDIE